MEIIRMAQTEVEGMMSRDPPRVLDLFEMFCGEGMASDLVQNAGGASRKFDRIRKGRYASTGSDSVLPPGKGHISEDACTLEGVIWAGYSVLQLRHGATVMFENECSTWINMTRATTGRRDHNIFGDARVRSVLEANMCAMVTREPYMRQRWMGALRSDLSADGDEEAEDKDGDVDC
eukprot:9467755-Pyramimonas_sp.AAC.1